MGGRRWMLAGAALGLGVALGEVPFVAGAARSLAAAAVAAVVDGGATLLRDAAGRGAPQVAVEVATALVAVLAPGVTALLAVFAARGTLQVRAAVSLLLAAIGAVSFAYQGQGHAAGALVLALAIGGLAVAATGPLVVAPLCALAGLLCGATLPALVQSGSLVSGPASLVHQAIYGTPGTPLALRVALVVVAAVPFGLAARSLVRR